MLSPQDLLWNAIKSFQASSAKDAEAEAVCEQIFGRTIDLPRWAIKSSHASGAKCVATEAICEQERCSTMLSPQDLLCNAIKSFQTSGAKIAEAEAVCEQIFGKTIDLLRNAIKSFHTSGMTGVAAEAVCEQQFGSNMISTEMFDDMESTWAPPDNPVFKLTPDSFDIQARQLYTDIGNPVVDLHNFWVVYADLLNAFVSQPLDETFHDDLAAADDHFEVPMDLIPNQQNLPHGLNVVGSGGYEYLDGLTVPPGEELDESIDPREYASFTDEEEEAD
ncbi:hypothetical protein B0H17DRAFT_1338992 [Mycena rosella]|uniref:Uncharacterized protein n=1 Tax=Mycena rosella TaxID=1033263 RepID=A0AAD7CDK0_MYCRO|nr:hypothetical protein B0H17DRAFT_1338992 [Mycena rosella]